MKFQKNEETSFGWDGLKAWPYNSKEDFARASAISFEVTTSHGKIKTSLSDRVYLVLEGNGEYVIDGVTIPVQKDDVIIVPKNTPYDYYAKNGTTLKVFLVHTPAYDAEYEHQLD